MFHKIFTWLSTGNRLLPKAVGKELDQLWAAVGSLRDDRADLVKLVDKLQADLEQLQSEHRKLRGRFYKARGEFEEPQNETKAQVLARIGYVPGRPAPHKG